MGTTLQPPRKTMTSTLMTSKEKDDNSLNFFIHGVTDTYTVSSPTTTKKSSLLKSTFYPNRRSIKVLPIFLLFLHFLKYFYSLFCYLKTQRFFSPVKYLYVTCCVYLTFAHLGSI